MRIAQLTLHRLEVPLAVPYRLSLGVLAAFDTLLVELRGSEGPPQVGEATYLAGYTDETPDSAWQLARELAPRLLGRETPEAAGLLEPYRTSHPFTATAFGTALEALDADPHLGVETPTRVPLLGLLHATDARGIERESADLLAQGYHTLKVKVGFDVLQDSALVRRVQRLLAGRATIRLDANQGFARDEACRFAAGLDPAGIELFEQPCAAGDWDAARAVARVATVPLMLDESIYGENDIKRAAELGAARFIKLKLMKLGGLARLARALELIRDCGMEPVLGNGVACEVGCWMEACVARARVTNAGEMNGFLKPSGRLLKQPLAFEGGAIVLEPGFRPELDHEAVRRCTVARQDVP